MKNILALSISILLFSGCFFSAHAAPALSKDDIQNFMNAMKPLQVLGEKYDMDENKDPPDEDTGFENFLPPCPDALEKCERPRII